MLVLAVLALGTPARAVTSHANAAASPSRTLNVPTFTVAVTDSNGRTIAAVAGTAASRAATSAAQPVSTAPMANTGRQTQDELGIGVGLVLAGAMLVTLGRRRPQHRH